MPRKRDYPIIRFLIGSFYTLAGLVLVGGLASAGYLWIQAEAIHDGVIFGGPLSKALHPFKPDELYLGAALSAGVGLVGFLFLGAIGQVLAMQRDRAIHGSLQTQLLEDILELNEEAARVSQMRASKVELCEGCGRLGSLQQIDSGQWICRDCRRQLRSA
ncbi:MAG TPA: hypothetical protein PKG54_10565 [Phycisphaerae bacterium]|jgi:hypothetical protein|nr:hypothetical protein [Phycisphaerae bacterium]HOJ55748.1 hypothetical protein [Phycisphaerae bacterium]HOL25766.1 hypothetical protein [Phycisphaerae bacterium]HPP19541.1 hypothetical protein [Phycisphaerae bacterium]HPU32655.1 hypothetical protein [Phycisphaerae bacterium]